MKKFPKYKEDPKFYRYVMLSTGKVHKQTRKKWIGTFTQEAYSEWQTLCGHRLYNNRRIMTFVHPDFVDDLPKSTKCKKCFNLPTTKAERAKKIRMRSLDSILGLRRRGRR